MPEFLERYLKKSKPEEITYGDLEGFLRQGVEEHQTLEYKPRGLLVRRDDTVIRETDPRQVVGFTALAKSVAGFANAEGGLLVLGVKEKEEKYKGQVVKIRPGGVHPLPLTVTREMIENKLAAQIQFPIEGITIVPLRRTPRSKKIVFLIDVPQSFRAPHRVNEIYYFQRYNFSTLEMKHYQIADLFGRRFAPSLDISVESAGNPNPQSREFGIRVLIQNRGRAVAKYAMCVCSLIDGQYRIINSPGWDVSNDGLRCQFATGFNSVVYPDVNLETGVIMFRPLSPTTSGSLSLSFALLAEGMPRRNMQVTLDPYAAGRTASQTPVR